MSERDLEIIRLLADGALHSGEDIAGRLGISRAAVCKAVRKAADALDLDVEAQRGRGYRLRQPLELLDADRIVAALPAPARELIRAVLVLEDVGSTNDWLSRRAAAGEPGGVVCLAERQHAGRGRHGRGWVSPFGSNLYLSMLWRYPLAPAQLGGLSLAAGVAVARALRGAGADGIGLKWPNDLHWRRRKIGGLLLEVAGESQGPSRVVAGVGINLRLDPARAQAIDQPWTDLATVLGAEPPQPRRNAIAAAVIAELALVQRRFASDGLAPFLAAWRELDAYLGEPVSVVLGEQRIDGIHAGVDADGALMLETDAGLRVFQGGEVSLRGR